MLKSHEKINSANWKRLVLIVDDEAVNRELLGTIVADDYEALYAADGREAMEIIREKKKRLSVVLLDMIMPVMDGFEVMRAMHEDSETARIPIIVLTADTSKEVDCLKLGASDFIAKPFSMPEVILARIQKTIELSEDRTILQATEREELTGLFNKDFFFKYADRYDMFHPDLAMDAIAFNVNHFHLLNEVYGRDYGDGVLADVSAFMRDLVEQLGGMATRLESDKFLFYVPHNDETDYDAILENLNSHFTALSSINVKVRIGMYRNVDKSIGVKRCFDRALRVANTAKDKYTRLITCYDETAYNNDIYFDQLINEMQTSLADRQFEVYFQPKYSVAGPEPRIVSAEALIRWNHPLFGMIRPDVFVPLFEDNGLIWDLDCFTWETVADCMKAWERELGLALPVSVNVSRRDLFDPRFKENLTDILARYDSPVNRFYLEITESAYTEATDQLLETIAALRSSGFTIEMDDFGSGYSSLNMLSLFPLDVLKLDMKFIQDITVSKKKASIVRFVMELAKEFSLDVVAEGVETREQVEMIRAMGGHIMQGYYFSKPLPEAEFRNLLIKEKK